MRLHATTSTALVVFAAVSFASAQTASTPDAARAQDLFTEGKALFDAGKYSEACRKLEESQRIDANMRTQFGLADCLEKLGRLASAWRNFDEVTRVARAAGKTEHEEFAQSRARALLPRLSRLAIVVPPSAAAVTGLIVTRDGARVDSEEWGQATPVDPGVHRVEASAPGHGGWSLPIETRGEGTTVTVEVPVLESLAPAEPRPAIVPAPVATMRHDVLPQKPASTSALRIGGILVGSAGLLTLGAGGVLGLLAKSRFDDSAPHCPDGTHCEPEGLTIRQDAYDRGTVATGVFIAGGIVTVAGVVMFLLAPSRAEPEKAATVAPIVTAGPSDAAAGARVRW